MASLKVTAISSTAALFDEKKTMQLAKIIRSFTELSIVTLKASVEATVYHIMVIYHFSLHSLPNPHIICLELDDGEHDCIHLKPVASLLEVLTYWLASSLLVHTVPMLCKPLGHCPASLSYILHAILHAGKQVDTVGGLTGHAVLQGEGGTSAADIDFLHHLLAIRSLPCEWAQGAPRLATSPESCLLG